MTVRVRIASVVLQRRFRIDASMGDMRDWIVYECHVRAVALPVHWLLRADFPKREFQLDARVTIGAAGITDQLVLVVADQD